MIQINFQSKIKQLIESNNFSLKMIATYTLKICTEKINYLNNILKVIEVYHPKNILKKGYAIPRYNGKLLQEQTLYKNEELEIELQNKTLIVSIVRTVFKNSTARAIRLTAF